jgi:starch phosphorylase
VEGGTEWGTKPERVRRLVARGASGRVTGWAISDGQGVGEDPSQEMASLYDKLEHVILPLFYRQPVEFAQVMRSAIALNGSFFNAQRMVFQYLRNAYFGVES